MSSKSEMLKPEEKPLVSIITPSYNQGAFIGETIQSVLGQDYPHLEYVIMDGGSSDTTLDVIRDFHDPRLTWVSEADRGMTHALNKGFGRSAGQIMGWLNSDDVFLMQTVVSEAVDYFHKYPEADLLYRDAIYTDAAGKPTGRKQQGKPFDIINTMSYLNSVPQPATFWRRSLWEKLGDLREDLQFAMDGEYWIRAWVNGASLHHLAGERATYRLHENSKTVSGTIKHWLERVKIAEEYLSHPKVGPHERMIRANLAYMLGKLYLEQGNRQEAQHWANKAIQSLPRHRRALLVLGLWSDAYLNTGFLAKINH
jgi:glycosyltransferase involved in cell wall biosynthesis